MPSHTHKFIRPESFGFRKPCEECISLFISGREICQKEEKFQGKCTYLAFFRS